MLNLYSDQLPIFEFNINNIFHLIFGTGVQSEMDK